MGVVIRLHTPANFFEIVFWGGDSIIIITTLAQAII